MNRKFVLLTLCTFLLALLVIPATAGTVSQSYPSSSGTVDIIILTNSSTAALSTHIHSVGGVVNFEYQNVPAVAARVPADQLGTVASFAGVTSIQKDQMVYLNDDLQEIGNEPRPMSYVVENMIGVEVQAVDLAALDLGTLPHGYANFHYTGAYDVWEHTMGEGIIVAVVDTGTAPNVCLAHAVIGAPGFPNGYSAVMGPPFNDPYPANSPLNHWHGTHVAGDIASACALDFSANPDHPIYLAQQPYLDWPVDFVPVFGQAPEAQIYPVKVFPYTGGGVPSSVILDGLDHILTLKKEGLLDIDIVNMSLGGPTFWDGRDAYDRFMEELLEADILVVTSAGNSGPIPNSVGSPGTSFGVLSVGALDYAPSSRVLYEYIGLAIWPGSPGMGLIMRPSDETRVVNYSSRGPLSDGRFGPEITALGHWNFQAGPQDELRWAGGTSFASPTVAGSAALLNSWWKAQGNITDPTILENVLLLGADPEVVGPIWQGINDQGYGTLNVAASLDHLMTGNWALKPATKTGPLTANVLGNPVPGKVEIWESDLITLVPAEPFNAVFAISDRTSKVTMEVFDIDIPDNWDWAYWPNALEVHVQSAKRSVFSHPVDRYWYPWFGNSFQIVIEDGPWTSPWGLEANQPMEPGLMKLSLIGDYSNEDPVSFRVRITRENYRVPLHPRYRIASGVIKMGDTIAMPVTIPEGTNAATFDLLWARDWSKFPTSDIDVILVSPSGGFVWSGATANAPERAIVVAPEAGEWLVIIDAYEVNRSDNYSLYLILE